MNHIYRLVWNQVLNAWVAVSENAKGRGKSASARKCIVGAIAALCGPMALAAPVGGQVSAGVGAIAQAGLNTTITQSSQNLAINWQSFGIAANEAVRFNQPNAAAIALNRVTGQNPSQILGSISANGQVFVLNPNGVLFGTGSRVNVGGLVASTLNLSDADFVAGKHNFNGTTGTVINQGTLTASKGGYIALLAPEVRNEGVISATLGTALLAAGDKVTLNLNNGSLISYSIDQGSLNALAENKQLIQADGGQVFMSAKAADALGTAVVNNTGIIEARTIQNVSGVIKLLGDMQAGTVNVGGTLDASAPSPSASFLPLPHAGGGQGRGGFIETSAAHVKIADDAKVTTASSTGLSGTWLLDPYDFTIAATGGDMTGALLSTSLGTGNVSILSTSGTAGTAGDVNVNDAVTWSANKLTLNAQNNININANLNGSGTASLALQYGQKVVANGNTSDYYLNNGSRVDLPAGQNFSTTLGSDGVTKTFTVITSLGVASDTTTTTLQGMKNNLSGNYALGANIDATATSGWNSGAGFTPIGTEYGGQDYKGVFDGLGHTIKNITIKISGSSVAAPIPQLAATGTIQNIGLSGGTVTASQSYAAGLAAQNSGLIRRAWASVNVQGNVYTGGLVGQLMPSGKINESYASGAVNGTNSYAGGLVGGLSGGSITNSFASGSVSGSTAGGLVGMADSGSIANSYAFGQVSGSTTGGVIGRVGMTDPFMCKNMGVMCGATVSNSFWDTQTTGQPTSGGSEIGKLTVDMKTQSTFANWDFTSAWSIASGANSGYPSLKNVPLLFTATPITLNLANTSKTYGDANPSLTSVTITGALNNGDSLSSVLWGSAVTQYMAAGTYAYSTPNLLSPTFTFGAGHSLADYAISWSSNSLTVNPRPITLATDAKIKTYGSADPAFTYQITAGSLVNSDTLSGALTRASGNNVGIYALNQGTLANSNYAITYTGANFTINPKQLTPSGLTVPASKVYDGTTNVSVTGSVALLTSEAMGTGSATDGKPYTGDNINISGTATGTYNSKDVATANSVTFGGLSLTGAQAGNYSLTMQGNSAATITPKPLTATVAAPNKTYDGNTTATPTLTITGGLVGTETVTATGTANFNTKDVSTANLVTVNSTALADGTTGLASNYSLAAGETVAANINAINLAVTGVTASSKVYDGTTAATLTGTAAVAALTGDFVNVGGTGSGVFANKDVGTAKAVTVSGYTLSGADASNYNVVQPAGLTANITDSTTKDLVAFIVAAPVNVVAPPLMFSNLEYVATTIPVNQSGNIEPADNSVAAPTKAQGKTQSDGVNGQFLDPAIHLTATVAIVNDGMKLPSDVRNSPQTPQNENESNPKGSDDN